MGLSPSVSSQHDARSTARTGPLYCPTNSSVSRMLALGGSSMLARDRSSGFS